MDNEIALISDGDGLAVIGEPSVVAHFLDSEGLTSVDLGLDRLRHRAGAAAGALQAASEISAGSGRWVQLTTQSAELAKKYPMVTKTSSGLQTGVLRGEKGRFVHLVEFARGPGATLTSPAFLAGAAGVMAQVAMQQTMDEITDYLATIDQKVDDVLRAQSDAVLADMIGVDLTIEEAMSIREHTGRVSETTWSKVQATSMTIARTQGYALRQLDALAEKLESKRGMGDLVKAAKEAETKAAEWLVVLARCVQLQDAIAILELDRVLDAEPEQLDAHRQGLQVARQKRRDAIADATRLLITRLDAAAGYANNKVLLNPIESPAVVRSSAHVAAAVIDFQERLGIEASGSAMEARRWLDAASDVKDRALETGAGGVDVAKRLGSETLGRAKSATAKFSSRMDTLALRRRDRTGD